jgi:hypothetical protein
MQWAKNIAADAHKCKRGNASILLVGRLDRGACQETGFAGEPADYAAAT